MFGVETDIVAGDPGRRDWLSWDDGRLDGHPVLVERVLRACRFGFERAAGVAPAVASDVLAAGGLDLANPLVAFEAVRYVIGGRGEWFEDVPRLDVADELAPWWLLPGERLSPVVDGSGRLSGWQVAGVDYESGEPYEATATGEVLAGPIARFEHTDGLVEVRELDTAAGVVRVITTTA